MGMSETVLFIARVFFDHVKVVVLVNARLDSSKHSGGSIIDFVSDDDAKSPLNVQVHGMNVKSSCCVVFVERVVLCGCRGKSCLHS